MHCPFNTAINQSPSQSTDFSHSENHVAYEGHKPFSFMLSSNTDFRAHISYDF